MKRKVLLIISILIGCVFLYLGFSEMWQKHEAAAQAEAVFSASEQNPSQAASDGLDNLQ